MRPAAQYCFVVVPADILQTSCRHGTGWLEVQQCSGACCATGWEVQQWRTILLYRLEVQQCGVICGSTGPAAALARESASSQQPIVISPQWLTEAHVLWSLYMQHTIHRSQLQKFCQLCLQDMLHRGVRMRARMSLAALNSARVGLSLLLSCYVLQYHRTGCCSG